MSLFKLNEWIKAKEPLAFTRLSMICLPILSPLGLSLRNVQPDTKVPPDVFGEIKTKAEEVAGQPCPVQNN